MFDPPLLGQMSRRFADNLKKALEGSSSCYVIPHMIENPGIEKRPYPRYVGGDVVESKQSAIRRRH
jgi:hypothetical protein